MSPDRVPYPQEASAQIRGGDKTAETVAAVNNNEQDKHIIGQRRNSRGQPKGKNIS